MNNLKYTYLIAFLIFTNSCINKGSDINIPYDVQEDYQKIAEESNSKVIEWQLKKDRLIMLGDVDIDLAIQYKDSLLKSDKSLSKFEKSIITCIAGEIHIKYERYQEALDYFNKAESIDGNSPRLQVNKAICYVKLDNVDKAFIEINTAVKHNDYYCWYLGNLYEIIGDKEKAIEQYIYLYSTDKEYYTYCKERADYLKTNDAILYTEIIQDFDFGYGYVLLN